MHGYEVVAPTQVEVRRNKRWQKRWGFSIELNYRVCFIHTTLTRPPDIFVSSALLGAIGKFKWTFMASNQSSNSNAI